jgi:hypothetical protein
MFVPSEHNPDNLISPECSFRDFCSRVLHLPSNEIISAASAELAYHNQANLSRTGTATIRSGSSLRKYSDDLKALIRVLMGQVPSGVREGFIDDLRPLMLELLRHTRIAGNVEQVFHVEARAARQSGGEH